MGCNDSDHYFQIPVLFSQTRQSHNCWIAKCYITGIKRKKKKHTLLGSLNCCISHGFCLFYALMRMLEEPSSLQRILLCRHVWYLKNRFCIQHMGCNDSGHYFQIPVLLSRREELNYRNKRKKKRSVFRVFKIALPVMDFVYFILFNNTVSNWKKDLLLE